MPNCAAIGCTNRSNNLSNENVSFHKIPSEKNKSLRQQWLHNIRREGDPPKDSGFYICSIHFESDCFEQNMQVNFLVTMILHCLRYLCCNKIN